MSKYNTSSLTAILSIPHSISPLIILILFFVDRILSNTDSDNQIDLITAQNKKYTLKDEIVTYIFLVPVFIATATPFLIAFNNNEWTSLSIYVKESYQNLDQLPTWYKYVLSAIIIDVLGFRSFARRLFDKWLKK